MATHSSVLAWRIPGAGEPDGLPSIGLHRVGHDWSDLAAASLCTETCFPDQLHIEYKLCRPARKFQLFIYFLKVKFLSCVRLFMTPWTGVYQAPPSMEFSRREYWNGFPFPSPKWSPYPGVKPGLFHCRQTLYHLSHLGIRDIQITKYTTHTHTELYFWSDLTFNYWVSIKSWKMMLWKCCTQYASTFGKLSSGHRTGKGQFSLQSLRRAMPKNAQTMTQLHSSHTQVK